MKNDINKMYDTIKREGRKISAEIKNLRRWFHENPELGFSEYQTTARLKKELTKLNLKIVDKKLKTGFWAELNTGKPGPVIAIRSDIDALPIVEKTGLSYASHNKGISHACGHDVHMAVLVGAARILSKMKKELRGKIKFICQPAEEVPPGGAILLIDAGVLENPKVDAIISLHTDPTIPVGDVGYRDGLTMAATFDFDIRIIGQTGHAALPHRAIDAITVSAEVISGLQQVVSRMIDPVDPVVISFGTIKGGTVRNGIASEVILQGTARSLSVKYAKKLPGLIKRTAVNIAKGLGAKVEFIPIANYPPFVSNKRVNKFITDSYRDIYPKGKIIEIPKVLGGEDFASYMDLIPGAMYRLGIMNKKIGADKPWHNSAFKVDERAIEIGYISMAATAANLLSNWKK